MKLLLIVLVVINLVVFGWGYQRQQQSPRQDVQLELPAGVKRLQLVSEQGSLDPEVTVQADEEPVLEGAAEETALIQEPEMWSRPEEQVSAIPDVEPGLEAMSESAEEQQQEADLVAVVDPELEAEISSASSQEVLEVEGLEPESESQAALMPGAPMQADPVVPFSSPWHCFTFGAFERQNEADDVADRLQVLVDDIQGRQEVREKQVGYWVLVPAQGSREAARRKVQELLDAGIKDVWRFTKGDLANSISLGLFSNRAPAERHRRAVGRKGFAAEVRPRVIDQTSYWLDFRSTDVQGLPPDVLQELVRDYSGAKLATRECPVDEAL